MRAKNRTGTAELIKKIALFGERKIASRPGLCETMEFPLDIWKAMARDGLFKLGIPAKYGGTKVGYETIVGAGEALVRHGHNMGVALSWIIELLASGFMLARFGTAAQRTHYLPEMAKGKLIACIAFSEPLTGADPRHLRTTAGRDGDDFILNGEKAFLTNGPLADFFIVYAVTGIDKGRKRLSAFLVPKKNKNLTVTEIMELDFLRPSPHCTVRLEGCRVPSSARLGREGTALEEMARPCRMLEDALLNGPILGGIAWQMDLMLDDIRRKGAPADEVKKDFGEMEMQRQMLRWMAHEAARKMETRQDGSGPETLLVSFRALALDSQSTATRILERAGIEMEGELTFITKDIRRTLDLLRGGDTSRKKKLGEKVIGGKETNERVR